ncbi:MAG TPA: UDP-N-acetylmuramate dehydrogenase [Gemmatimonadaceae bacterium]|nr:UDP-N-acetylmuramate dehydrogenase [Gemmatimonadaceae bacterium]
MTRAITPLREAATRLATCLGSERLRADVVLAPFTTFKIGGPADLFVEVAGADELAAIVAAAREADIPWFVLGLGANILVGDRGFRGLVVRNAASRVHWSADGQVTAESGTVMRDLILDSVRRGWSGLEHYVGIPSSLGGAVWQNLHFLSPAPERARTMFLAEVFESCQILAEDGARRTVDAAYVQFGYDDTVFHHRRDVVLAATLHLAPGDPATMRRVMEENLSWRGARHPWLDWFPSAGSIFKKLEGVGAGRLIDQCGLKGYRHGDAQISTMHANIIVNLGRATAADVRAVIATVQERVHEKFGYRLEPEIGFIGEF